MPKRRSTCKTNRSAAIDAGLNNTRRTRLCTSNQYTATGKYSQDDSTDIRITPIGSNITRGAYRRRCQGRSHGQAGTSRLYRETQDTIGGSTAQAVDRDWGAQSFDVQDSHPAKASYQVPHIRRNQPSGNRGIHRRLSRSHRDHSKHYGRALQAPES